MVTNILHYYKTAKLIYQKFDLLRFFFSCSWKTKTYIFINYYTNNTAMNFESH